MSESESQNLSVKLFAKHRHAKETSTLFGAIQQIDQASYSAFDGDSERSWYRMRRRGQWTWQGVDPVEMEAIFARIAHSDNSRSVDSLLDTVEGYRSGNWNYEWTAVGMQHQKRAQALADKGEHQAASQQWLQACTYFGIAAYPHLKGDTLALQSETLAYKAFEHAMDKLPFTVKTVETTLDGKSLKGYLYLPRTDATLPVVILSGSLDSLQTDLWRVFVDYFAPADIAVLTLDMPSVGHSSHWHLNEDTSRLHRAMLDKLAEVPWVDHHRVGTMGIRFGANPAVRLAFLEPHRVKASAALGGIVHSLLTNAQMMKKMPPMYLDTLGSRLGRHIPIDTLRTRLQAWSLKNQGLLTGRRTEVPILALSLKDDPVCPESDNKLIATYSRGGKAVTLPNTPLHDGYHRALSETVSWFANIL
ncbi:MULTISPECIES: esterase FrsA [Salinivibrio]|uniref:esterase FrsA n=1 Tax=Salinivibrio TaxID=51366 RepID=UPI000988B7A8|nr:MULTISPECIES: esterase FrsA [Salinivibrio]OOF18328.1 hypothetical protein BZG84_04580 [Salinivibrio sp. PR932]OOF32530.1 hypothetical protein BZJ20_01605 [Salinivibrio proteolyticus]